MNSYYIFLVGSSNQQSIIKIAGDDKLEKGILYYAKDDMFKIIPEPNLSKYPYAVATKTKSAIEIAKHFFNYISLFGAPKELVSDQGKEFLNEGTEFLIKGTS